MDTITLVTDGACSGNPGPGGWCVIVKKENEIKEFFGGELKTTNNKMELTAVIKGFENIDSYSNVTVKVACKLEKKRLDKCCKKTGCK